MTTLPRLHQYLSRMVDKDHLLKTGVFLLPFLILMTPFLNFLEHNSYPVTRPEVLICLIGIVAIAVACSSAVFARWSALYGVIVATLITFFVDLQFYLIDKSYHFILLLLLLFAVWWLLQENFYAIATVVFATFFLVTLLQLSQASTREVFRFGTEASAATRSSLPRLIHIIFDEHIGIEGIPTELDSGKALKEQLVRFYRRHGFLAFGGAFSHHYRTLDSIPNQLNFTVHDELNAHIRRRRGDNSPLLRNSYFGMLHDMGYDINVLSARFINFCIESPVPIENCYEYDSYGLKPVTDLDMPISIKVRAIVSRFLHQSDIYHRVKQRYRKIRNAVHETPLPSWTWDLPLHTNPLNTVQVLDDLWQGILSLPPANVLFAHLLSPHSPYITRADCSIRNSVTEWKGRRLPVIDLITANTPQSREERYPLYFEQVSCLYTKLEQLFNQMKAAGIYDDSIIILQGDHGSRIVLTEPFAANRDVLTHQDIIDGFSTLFAIKIPGQEGGYDTSPLPLEQLLLKGVSDFTDASPTFAPNRPSQFVYLLDGNKLQFVQIPYPGTP